MSLLLNAIDHLSQSFSLDELAYLALTSKPELHIRDRIAWHIHSLNQKILVAREWHNRDLVLLYKLQPVCIVELKAMYTFDAIYNPNKFIKWMREDINKARKESTRETEIYSVILAVHPHAEIPEESQGVVKFYKGINRAFHKNSNSSSAIKTRARNNFEDQFKRCPKLHYGGEIHAGSAFKIGVDILYWIYGPFKKQTRSHGRHGG